MEICTFVGYPAPPPTPRALHFFSLPSPLATPNEWETNAEQYFSVAGASAADKYGGSRAYIEERPAGFAVSRTA